LTKKAKLPGYYRAPLRSREAIVGFLLQHYDRFLSDCSPLAWGVKAYGVDLSYEHLSTVHQADAGELGWGPEQRKAARALYAEYEEHLWDWGVAAARCGVSDCDSFKQLWDGTELDVAYEFAGRSGGWLLMLRFAGQDLSTLYSVDFASWLADLEVKTLRNFYRLVVQCEHDFRREAVEAEIEYQAAFCFFNNICDDLRPELPPAPVVPRPTIAGRALLFSADPWEE
jgi:hypothetical protein